MNERAADFPTVNFIFIIFCRHRFHYKAQEFFITLATLNQQHRHFNDNRRARDAAARNARSKGEEKKCNSFIKRPEETSLEVHSRAIREGMQEIAPQCQVHLCV
jgi:hypothetical protein